MNHELADGAVQRLGAQIAEALFDQPGMTLTEQANRVRELRGDGPALLGPRKAGQNAMVLHARALELVGDAYNAGTHGIGYSQQAMELHDSILSAQPSPGGQGDALLPCPFCGVALTINGAGDGVHPNDSDCILAQHRVVADHQPQVAAWNRRAIAARQPDAAIGGDAHDIEDPCDVITRAAQKLSAAGQPRIADRLVRARTEVERLQAAYLAAHQPVRQEPAAWMTHHDEPMLYPTFQEAAAYCDDDEPPIPLYASQPAQAVDLGQFRDAVAWAYHALGNVSQRGPLGELLALIGGKAVGNG